MNIPEDRPLYDFQNCKSCTNGFASDTKKRKFVFNGNVTRCKVWNNMITKDKCEFYSPMTMTGIQQMILGMIRQIYPHTIRSAEFVEYEYKKR